MGEITKASGLELFVENTVHTFGEVGPEDVIEYSFPFLRSGDEIETIQKGCGCTSAYWDPETNSIRGTLNMKKAGPANGYDAGETPVNKYIWVWMNDGQPRFIADEKKQQSNNPKKTFIRLQLAGKVVK